MAEERFETWPHEPTEIVKEALRDFVGDGEGEDQRVLAAHDERVRAEQRAVDLAMHEAYRAEVVAETAVALGDQSDWEQVAAWCGGTISGAQDPSGEYASLIEIPGVGAAGEGSWIVRRLDGTFAIRATVDGPDGDTLERVRADERERVLEFVANWFTDDPRIGQRIVDDFRARGGAS